MTERYPSDKEVPIGSGDRALDTKREQIAMAFERLKNLDPKSSDFKERSGALTRLIEKLKGDKVTP